MLFSSFIFLIMFFYLVILINNEKERILFLFLDIPQKHINILYRKCEKFLINFQVNCYFYRNSKNFK